MIDFLKQSLMNDKTGEPSSSRVSSSLLVFCSIAGFLFAMFIIGHSYFVRGELPSSESILVYFLGGSASGAFAGAGLYAAGKFADRDLPVQPSEQIAIQNLGMEQVEDSLNNNQND